MRPMKGKGIYIEIDDSAKEFVAENGYSKIYGAREITRVIDQDIKEPLIDEILFGRLKGGGVVEVIFNKDRERLDFVFDL